MLLVNQYAFFTGSCIFTKINEDQYAKSEDHIIEENIIYKQNAYRSVGHILYPLFIWDFTLRTHYYHWFTVNVLLMVLAAMSSQVSCLLYSTNRGKWQCPVFSLQLLTINFAVLKQSDMHNIHQWQITLLIFAAVGAAPVLFLNLFNDGMGDWRVSTCFTIFLGPFIYVYCKNYLEQYVHPEKL